MAGRLCDSAQRPAGTGGQSDQDSLPNEKLARQPSEVVRNLSVSPLAVETSLGRQRKFHYRFLSPGQDALAVVDRIVLDTNDYYKF